MVVAALLLSRYQMTDIVEARLRKELAGVAGVRYSHDEDTLVVRYRTEVVNVPKEFKSAQKTVEKIAEERPSLTGFKLETYDFPHKPSDPPRAFQAVQVNHDWVRNYSSWKMDAGDRQIDGTGKARYYYLTWGTKADPKLIALVRSAFEKGTHPISK